MLKDAGDDCTWWDEVTPVYIIENVEGDFEQDKMLVAFMFEHPDYYPELDYQIEAAGYDPLAMNAYLNIYRFRAEALRFALNNMSLSEFWGMYGIPVTTAAIVLGGSLEPSEGPNVPNVFIPDHQFGQKMAQHGGDFGLNPRSPLDRQKFRELITDTAVNAVEIRKGAWRGSNDPHYFYRNGDVVVVATNSGEFVTILDKGSNNKWYLGADIVK